MDEIKCLLASYPVALEVIDLELKIWRNPGWLDGGEVISDYLWGRERISSIHTNIQNIAVIISEVRNLGIDLPVQTGTGLLRQLPRSRFQFRCQGSSA